MLDVGAETFGNVREFVHAADFCREHDIRGILRQLRRTNVHTDHPVVTAIERFVQGSEQFRRSRIIGTNDNAIGFHEVIYRSTFFEKLRIRDHIELDRFVALGELRLDLGEDGFQVKRLIVNPGAVLSLQKHARRAEHWVVVRGKARITKNDDVFDLGVNESTYIAVGDVHRIANPFEEPVHIIEVQCGDYLGEDDIVRIEDNYGREGTNT